VAGAAPLEREAQAIEAERRALQRAPGPPRAADLDRLEARSGELDAALRQLPRL
jgi:hypothetical protein